MAASKPSKSKLKALRERGCLNPRPEGVSDELFVTADFFDPNDLLQVKYEMVRRVCTEGQPISYTARNFGVSRPTVYQALAAFEHGGLAGLQPQRPGPRRAHKLSDEVIDFLESLLADTPQTGAGDLVAVVQKRFGLSVHARSIERALARRKKNAADLCTLGHDPQRARGGDGLRSAQKPSRGRTHSERSPGPVDLPAAGDGGMAGDDLVLHAATTLSITA